MKIAVSALLLFVTLGVSVFVGSTEINLSDEVSRTILFDVRLPRVLFAAVTGGMLGVSGSLFQLLLRNPLADGFTTGAASTAAVGASVALAFALPAPFVSLSAFVCSLLGLWLVLHIASTDRFISPVTLILAGVVLNIAASGGISFIKYLFEESIGSIVFWLMGGFFLVSWTKVALLGALFLTVTLIFLSLAPKLNILALDDATATTLGVNVRLFRRTIFILAALLVAVSVSLSGIIGFVGLIVPHVARALHGSDMRNNIALSAILGAVLLTAADALSRTIIPGGAELPVGVITAILGGGFFLFLLMKKRERIWYGNDS